MDRFWSHSVLEWLLGSISVGLVTGVDPSSVTTLRFVYVLLSRFSSMVVFSEFSVHKAEFILSLRYYTLVNNYIADTFMPTVWPNYMSDL